MLALNPIKSIITLNVNRPNTPIKRIEKAKQTVCCLQIYIKHENMMELPEEQKVVASEERERKRETIGSQYKYF